VAGAHHSVFDLLPRALVLIDEPESLKPEFDHVWSRIEQAHESSGVGRLVEPADLYLSRMIGGRTWGACPERMSNISRSRVATNHKPGSHFIPSRRRVSTVQFPPCLRK